jgi:cell division protein FtsB
MGQFTRELFRVAAGKTGWLAGLTLALAYAWMAFRGPQGIQSLVDKHREISDLEEQNADKARQIDALRERIKRLEQSGSEQELEIRKQLKLLRPGETTFLLPDPPKSSEAPAQ